MRFCNKFPKNKKINTLIDKQEKYNYNIVNKSIRKEEECIKKKE